MKNLLWSRHDLLVHIFKGLYSNELLLQKFLWNLFGHSWYQQWKLITRKFQAKISANFSPDAIFFKKLCPPISKKIFITSKIELSHIITNRVKIHSVSSDQRRIISIHKKKNSQCFKRLSRLRFGAAVINFKNSSKN